MAPEASDTDGGYSRLVRILLVVCCVLALVLAGGLVPSLTSGVADSPAMSALPTDDINPGEAQQRLDSQSSGNGSGTGIGAGGGGSGFGALNPGSSTDVGGETGVGGSGNAFRSQSNTVHFTVTSPEPAYWRTGAYDGYTGDGWRQTGGVSPLDEPIRGDTIQGERIEYEVTLNQTAGALPTIWRPNTIVGRSDIGVTEQRAFRAQEPLAAGTSYVGVSHRPPQDENVLKSAGTDYPAEITRRYARLPDDVPDRVEGFTDNLVEDDATVYQKAVTIEQWLEQDKTYSLNASQTSDNMADTFIFEMDRGYCEYFATSMVVMLRSQDIPARYVVGYSTGQQSGNTYTVRAMNAHAWVEVYFEDVGWVKFDPTPGSDRLQQEQESITEENPDAQYAPQEQGSPGETFSPDNETTPETPTPTPEPNNETDPTSDTSGETESGYDVSLNRTAVPGAAVEVSVSRDDEPAAGVMVLFNGDPVARTDAEGIAVATVPYASELRVSIEDGRVQRLDPPGSLPSSGERFYSVPPPDFRDVTVPVETNATITISGNTLPGSTVTVIATVDDLPVRNAAVSIDGELVAQTDDSGRATITLPNRTGDITIGVARQPITGETTVRLPELNVSVSPTLPLALPMTDATVTARAGGEPVSSANVTLNGRTVSTTGVNGTATVQLPFASSASLAVHSLGQRTGATIGGLLVNLGLVLGALAIVVAGVLAVAVRRGYSLRSLPRDILRFPTLLIQYAQWLLVSVATGGDRLFHRLLARIRQTIGHVVDLVRGTVTPAALWAALQSWFTSQRDSLTRRFSREATADGANTESTPTEAQRKIRAAWMDFLDYVSLGNYRTKTPGEIATHAVSRDELPAKPVQVLRDAFREIEYGHRVDSDRLERVSWALTVIEQSQMQDDTEETTPTEGGD